MGCWSRAGRPEGPIWAWGAAGRPAVHSSCAYDNPSGTPVPTHLPSAGVELGAKWGPPGWV